MLVSPAQTRDPGLHVSHFSMTQAAANVLHHLTSLTMKAESTTGVPTPNSWIYELREDQSWTAIWTLFRQRRTRNTIVYSEPVKFRLDGELHPKIRVVSEPTARQPVHRLGPEILYELAIRGLEKLSCPRRPRTHRASEKW